MDASEIRHHYQAVIRALYSKHAWSLLTEEELLAQALRQIPAATPADQLKHQIQSLFYLELYEACRPEAASERREKGYRQLYELLYHPARRRWNEMAEDVLQQTMFIVFTRFDSCKSPITFHAFALQQMRWAAQQVLRLQKKEEPLGDREMIAPDAFEELVLGELTDECREVLKRALETLGAVARQVLALKYHPDYEASDAVIADRLNLTSVNVRVIRFRALRQLRQNPALQQCTDQVNSELPTS